MVRGGCASDPNAGLIADPICAYKDVKLICNKRRETEKPKNHYKDNVEFCCCIRAILRQHETNLI